MCYNFLGDITSHLRLDTFKKDGLLISQTSIKIWFITLPITGHICSCAYKLQLQTIAESAFIAPFLHPRLHPIFYKMDQKSYKYKGELPNNYRALQKNFEPANWRSASMWKCSILHSVRKRLYAVIFKHLLFYICMWRKAVKTFFISQNCLYLPGHWSELDAINFIFLFLLVFTDLFLVL